MNEKTPFEQWWEESGNYRPYREGSPEALSEVKRIAHEAWIAAMEHVRDVVLCEEAA